MFTRFLPPLLALIGAWFGFANPWAHFPPAVLLLPAALVLAASRARSAGHAFRTGLLAALPGYAASLYWLAIPVHDHGGLPWALALPCPVLVGMVPAAYAGLYCAAMYLIRMRLHTTLAVLTGGLLWAGLELMRNFLLTGFPWLTLASALAPWPAALGAAAWIGGFGLSGMIAAMGHGLAFARGRARLAAPVLAALCLLPGLLREPAHPEGTVSVSMIQGDIDQGAKWDETLQRSILQTYLDLSRQAARRHSPDLMVWPETAMPFYFQDVSEFSAAVQNGVKRAGVPLLAGAPAYSMTAQPGPGNYVLHNRAYLLDSEGRTVSWYDKEHLVPFGEYVPLGEWLPFITKLVPGQFDFRPGIGAAPLRSGDMAMGLLVCYEAIFPELAQRRVEAGANVLVNISNDAWFGRSSAPLQHLHLAVIRAVEQNRAIVRATNTGVSAFIDPDGSLREASELFTRGIVHADSVPLLTETTFYHEHILLIHTTFPLLGLGLLTLAWLKWGRKKH
jgi:apolipoprotein N-acyltransferase